MKIAVFSTKSYDREFLKAANARFGHELVFFEPHLMYETCSLASGFGGVCVFVNDTLNADVLKSLREHGTRLVALRCAGFNNVDLFAAAESGITVVRVPSYSPEAVAEHTVALILSLNRKVHRAYARVREGNFSLEGLLGFNLHDKTFGIIGTGKIGFALAKILKGFGCTVLAYDPYPNPECEAIGVGYTDPSGLYEESDIISLHCPLNPETHHLIDSKALAKMKKGVMLINTSRGAVIDTKAVIDALKSGKIGYLGLDVYEEEGDLFFEDLSNEVIQDDVFARLLTFPNVLITGHQAFFTREALRAIAETTLSNISDFEKGERCVNQITAESCCVIP
ncbi:MAG: 2-hydroxyacid dehydrogenase [Thermodesulfobacteriota bacterium]